MKVNIRSGQATDYDPTWIQKGPIVDDERPENMREHS